MLHVFIFHGFQSNASSLSGFILEDSSIISNKLLAFVLSDKMKPFNPFNIYTIGNEQKRLLDEVKTKVKFYPLSWNSGQSEGTFERISNVIFGGHEYGMRIHEQWNNALEEIEKQSSEQAKLINGAVADGDHILFVGHSMGTHFITEIVKHLRSDSKISLFLMGGIEDKTVCEIALDERISYIWNFYTKTDPFLEGYLNEMNGFFYEPVGINEIDHQNAENYRCDVSHSGYMNDVDVKMKYAEVIRQLTGY